MVKECRAKTNSLHIVAEVTTVPFLPRVQLAHWVDPAVTLTILL